MNSEKLKNKYIINEDRIILPHGQYIWKSVTNSIVDKLSLYGFKECSLFSDDLENINLGTLDKIQFVSYDSKNELRHVSISFHSSLNEGARTIAIDILQAYVSISKNKLGLNVIIGKNVSFDNDEEYVMGIYFDNMFHPIGSVKLIYLESGYKVISQYNAKIIEHLAYVNKDELGLIFNKDSSFFQIGIVPLKMKEINVLSYVRKLKQQLETKGYRVCLDESNASEKEKLDLYFEQGIPLIIEVGPRDIMSSSLEILKRTDRKVFNIKEEKLFGYIDNLLKSINSILINNQIEYLNKNTYMINELNDLKDKFEEGKKVNVIWDGEEKSYFELNKIMRNSLMILPFNQELFYSKSIISNLPGKYVLTIMKI